MSNIFSAVLPALENLISGICFSKGTTLGFGLALSLEKIFEPINHPLFAAKIIFLFFLTFTTIIVYILSRWEITSG